jgi:hypothetical protein
LYYPTEIAFDAADALYIVDYNNHRIVMIRDGVAEVIVSGLDNMGGITIGPDGSLYVAKTYNHVILRY